MNLADRIKNHAHISAALASFSDAGLSELLNTAKPLHSGIGGTSALLTIDDTRVFVKKIPLTDIERQPKNFMSTANIFDLPLFCQYRVGSPGFGAWRDLVAHVMTTEWVLAGECPNFPITYHWRVLPTSNSEPMISEELEDVTATVKFWDGSEAVRNRREGIQNASAHIVLFLEYVPETLLQWLGNQLKAGGAAAERALSFVEENLKVTEDFMNARGFVHFDTHFENIVTDGGTLYLCDFGLALASKFDLTEAEIAFLRFHRTYDRCVSIVSLLHCLITSSFGKDEWPRFRHYINVDHQELAPALSARIKRYGPIAVVMSDFYRDLQKETKLRQFPAIELQRLLAALD